MNFKKRTIIIILFIVVISAAVGFMAWRTYPDWETYKNEKYGFKFKYPSNRYELKETSISSNKFKVFLEEKSTTKSTARGITVIENEKVNDLTSSLNIIEKEKVVVDKKEGVRAKIRNTNGKGPEIAESIFVKREDNVFRFTWPVDSVLSTFEFIE